MGQSSGAGSVGLHLVGTLISRIVSAPPHTSIIVAKPQEPDERLFHRVILQSWYRPPVPFPADRKVGVFITSLCLVRPLTTNWGRPHGHISPKPSVARIGLGPLSIHSSAFVKSTKLSSCKPPTKGWPSKSVPQFNAYYNIMTWQLCSHLKHAYWMWQPVVDNALFTDYPSKLLGGNHKDVDIMVG
jgi:hypothetical protein